MIISSELDDLFLKTLKQQHGENLNNFIFPPPVFEIMQGKFLSYDPDCAILSVRFPVLESWLNPYGIMQGGMVAAAIDNSIGPLSALVASANVTRSMELKYSRAVTPEMKHVFVTAQLVNRNGRWLTFKAEARNSQGQRLIRAKARHWILNS